jgi:peptidoglycan/LPS O-acetylase OafA/YrhL
MSNGKRVEVIDGFRCISIVSVMLYHFYWRWTAPLNPIDFQQYDQHYWQAFSYGYLGVQFFFIISGFVIFYTLDKSENISVFFINRFIRLFPPILFCSILTFFLVDLLDSQNQLDRFHSHTYLNFLPSLTFTTQELWNGLLDRSDIRYISGSYWSLAVEVLFYILAGVLYFYNRKKILWNWLLLVWFFTLLRIISSPKLQFLFPEQINLVWAQVNKFILLFNTPYFVYFTIGIFMYTFFMKKSVSKIEFLLGIGLVLLEFYFLPDFVVRLALLTMIGLFTLFLYKEEYLSFLKWNFITRVGVISYTLYLIHENLGMILINKFAQLVERPSFYVYIPIVVIAIFVVFAEWSYRYYETPVTKYLKKKLVKSNVTKI